MLPAKCLPMNDIVSGAMSEIKIAVKHVNEMSTENSKNFNELKLETEKFIVTTGTQKQTVFIVDDDEVSLTAVSGMLKKHYEVITAKSGNEALGYFYRGLILNVILLDIMMPDMDGWDTFKRIKAISDLHTIPTAFFTSSDDQADKTRAIKMGAADFILKPVNQSELLARINRLVNR